MDCHRLTMMKKKRPHSNPETLSEATARQL
jgi:hypothetical protein